MQAEDLVASPPAPAFDASRAWLAWQFAWLILGALLLLWIFEGTELDRAITRFFFDADSGAFPLRHAWFLEAVMHTAAKQTSYLLVAASLHFCWQGWRGRLAWLPPRNLADRLPVNPRLAMNLVLRNSVLQQRDNRTSLLVRQDIHSCFPRQVRGRG